MDFDKLKDELTQYTKRRYTSNDSENTKTMEFTKAISAVSSELIVEALKLYHQQLDQE